MQWKQKKGEREQENEGRGGAEGEKKEEGRIVSEKKEGRQRFFDTSQKQRGDEE